MLTNFPTDYDKKELGRYLLPVLRKIRIYLAFKHHALACLFYTY